MLRLRDQDGVLGLRSASAPACPIFGRRSTSTWSRALSSYRLEDERQHTEAGGRDPGRPGLDDRGKQDESGRDADQLVLGHFGSSPAFLGTYRYQDDDRTAARARVCAPGGEASVLPHNNVYVARPRSMTQ
jgi:hypothetical protein